MGPSAPVAQPLIDKASSFKFAAAAGLDVPAWHVLGSDAECEGLGGIEFPAIVRPARWDSAGRLRAKVEVVGRSRELETLSRQVLTNEAKLIVQTYINTTDRVNRFVLVYRAASGDTRTVAGRKCLEDSEDGGIMVWGVTEAHARSEQLAIDFVDHIDFEGFGGIEFLEAEDRLWFVEFNPRLEAIHFLSRAGGADIFGGLLAPSDQLAPVVDGAAIWLGLPAVARLARNPSSLLLLIRAWVRYRKCRPRLAGVWDVADPLPAIVACWSLIKLLLVRALGRR